TNLTFPHPMLRLMFSPQIYPPFNIITREPYHKSCGFFTPFIKPFSIYHNISPLSQFLLSF
ncbi:23S rRNA (pseudouridine(1915)-N(3))-methyltransferase RlmH, partial [Staphylococcus epidermidis]|uniref:23S rRNA (pseudouridine(1915)-N(3))-methyltransferase RlmH n=1 Tax=Staphylococcus epidermidis TaxID=1282 RepID=UPI0016434C9B